VPLSGSIPELPHVEKFKMELKQATGQTHRRCRYGSYGRRWHPLAGHTILAVYQHEPLHSVEIFLGRFWWKVSKFCETYDGQELDAAAKRLRVQGGVDISVLRPTLISLLAGPIVEHRFTNGHVVWTRNDSNTAKILLDTTSLSSK
jgi:hypothetical protein